MKSTIAKNWCSVLVCLIFFLSRNALAAESVIWQQPFESGLDGWTTIGSAWQVGKPTSGPGKAHQGTNVAATVLAGNYPPNQDARLISPAFAVPSIDQNPRLRFWHWYSFGRFDSGQVQIRIGAGAWQNLGPSFVNWSSTWTEPSLDLSSFAGKTVQVAFLLHSENHGYGDDESGGWYVDEVELITGPIVSLTANVPESFETGLGDWWADSGVWEVGKPTSGPGKAHQGTNLAATVLAGNYPPNQDARLISPAFAVPSIDQNPRLRFWHWYSFGRFDSGQVQIRIGAGAWQNLGPSFVNWSSTWTEPSLDLSSFAGKTVQVAFLLHSENHGYGDDESGGWYVDEVELITGPIVSLTANVPESFETGLGDWWADSGVWEVGKPTSGPGKAHQGTNLAATVLADNYPPNQDARLISPAFAVPSIDQNPRLRFWHWYSFGRFDSGQVQIRIGAGAWQDIGTSFVNWSSTWTEPSLDLSSFAGKTVQVAFLLHSENHGYGDDESSGWYVDEVELITGPIVSLTANVPESFETGLGDWWADSGVWEVGKPTSGPGKAHQGTNLAATVLAGNYPPNQDARLISPAFAVPSIDQNPRLRFWHWYSFGRFDSGQVQIRIGAGAWQNLGPSFVNWSSTWTEPSLDLSSFAGKTVQVAFLLHSENHGYGDDESGGWYVDEVELITGPIVSLTANVPESFETGLGDWWADSGVWEVGKPTSGPGKAHQGTNLAATVLAGNYPPNQDARLISPAFAVPSIDQNPRLRFWHWYSFGRFDSGQVQIRIGAGAWQDIGTSFANGNATWTSPSLDLSSFAGKTVQVAFLLHSENHGYGDDESSGWYVDEVRLKSGPDVYRNPEDFELGWGDWSTEDYSFWEIGAPVSGPPIVSGSRAHSPNSVAATLLAGNYSGNSSARLISPSFPVPSVTADGLIVARFWQWYQYGTGDSGKIEASIFTGSGWSDWATLAVAATNSTSTAWKQSVIDLSSYQGQLIRLGFLHTANGDASVGKGWMIDDLSISDFIPTPAQLGVPLSSSFSSTVQRQYFVFDVPPGGHLRINLKDSDGQGATELYLRRGALPTPGSYDARSTSAGASQSVFAPDAGAGKWYALAYNAAGLLPGDFTIEADFITGIVLDSASPTKLGNGASGVITIEGAGLAPDASVSLIGNGRTNSSSNVSVTSSSHLIADFDLLETTPGVYDLQVMSGTNNATLAGAITVVSAGQARLETHLVVPGQLGRHAPATIYIQYANTGDVAMPAPLLVLTGSQRPILAIIEAERLLDYQQGFWTSVLPEGWRDTVQFLGTGKTPGLLQPGESNTISVAYSGLLEPWDFSQSNVRFDLGVMTVTNSTPVDWDSIKDKMRPSGITVDAWEPLWASFTTQTGTTWGDYVRMLNRNASYLRNLGIEMNDLNGLLGFAFAQADGLNVIRTLASSTDAGLDAPGLPLIFARSYSQSLSRRYALSSLGRGWSHNWDFKLMFGHDVPGDVNQLGSATITGPGGSHRVFQPDGRISGAYFSEVGDHGMLTQSGDNFILTEPNGLKRVFSGNSGHLLSVEDSNGNRIEASYLGEILQSLTHSSGQKLILAYTGGLLASVTDSDGRSTTYDYESQQLSAAHYYDGSAVAYHYLTGLGAAREHALAQIDYPGATHEYFGYDDSGRLADIHRDGNTETLSFAYEGAGIVALKDALTNKTRFFLNHNGQLAKIENPLKNILRLAYDSEFNLTSIVDPAGRTYDYDYDSKGNLIESADPLGGRTRFLYGDLNRLASVTDAKGNITRYAHDPQGNLNAVTYANGTMEKWGYDELGNPKTWTNRRANAIGYTHNARGQLTLKSYPDGSKAIYDYNPRGNLKLASNYTGVITLDYFPDDRLKRITYPENRWLEYAYDEAGRRASVTDQLGYKVGYLYDLAGRLQQLTNSDGFRLVLYEYDLAGRLSRKTLGNGVYTTNAYDNAGQLISLVNRKPDNSLLSSFDYTYDERGRRKKMETHYGVWTYGYDDLGQLTNAKLVSTDSTIPNQDLTYIYDALGNRIRTIENGVRTEYTANSLNQYTQVGATVLNYDADGSLTQKVAGATTLLTITNNFENRVTGFGSANGKRKVDYDALGFPTIVTRDGVRSFQVYDPFGLGDLIGVYDSAGKRTERQDHGFGTLDRGDGNSLSFVTFDAMGNGSDATGSGGTSTGSQVFSPFGTPLKQAAGLDSLDFGGEFGIAQEGDLDFMRARYYDPSTGHFISRDPLGFLTGPNTYSYVNNAPTSFSDSTGLCRDLGNEWGAALRARDRSPNDLQLRDLEHFLWTASQVQEAGKHGRIWQTTVSTYWILMTGGYSGAKVIGSPLRWVGLWKTTSPTWSEFWSGLAGTGDGQNEPRCAPDSLKPNPPSPPTNPTSTASSSSSSVIDPNHLSAPSGYGPQNFLSPDTLFGYQIEFENATNANAAVQVAVISDPLANSLDWSTLQLTEIAFGDHVFSVPPGSQHFAKVEHVTYLGVNFDVQIDVALNPATGVLIARFDSIDPKTGLPPQGSTAVIGFLPPEPVHNLNDTPPVPGQGRGQGHVSFTIRPKPSLLTGTEIRNIGTITFDPAAGGQTYRTDLSIPTDPHSAIDTTKQALVTIDADLPSSSISALPVTASGYAFEVSWSGTDVGAGVSAFDIYVSTNSAPWEIWLNHTTTISALFQGLPGQTYGFYAVAYDGSGNRQPRPITGTPPQSQTATPNNVAPQIVPVPDLVANVRQSLLYTNAATDIDLPPQLLTYSLDPGAPAGAFVSSEGLFHWVPRPEQASTTNLITVRVADNGVPPLSSATTFKVIVNDYVAPGLGSHVLLAGESGSVPITLISSVGISKLNFELLFPGDRVTGWSISSSAPQIEHSVLLSLTPNVIGAFFTNFVGQSLVGTQEVAHLTFTTAADQFSAFVPLVITNIYAEIAANGKQSTNVFIQAGRIAIIGTQPLLEAAVAQDGTRTLTVFGLPNAKYRLEYTQTLEGHITWSEAAEIIQMTDIVQTVRPASVPDGVRFLRVRQEP